MFNFWPVFLANELEFGQTYRHHREKLEYVLHYRRPRKLMEKFPGNILKRHLIIMIW